MARGLLCPPGRPRGSSGTWVPAWPLGSQTADARSLSLPFFLYNSAFQINLNKNCSSQCRPGTLWGLPEASLSPLHAGKVRGTAPPRTSVHKCSQPALGTPLLRDAVAGTPLPRPLTCGMRDLWGRHPTVPISVAWVRHGTLLRAPVERQHASLPLLQPTAACGDMAPLSSCHHGTTETSVLDGQWSAVHGPVSPSPASGMRAGILSEVSHLA